MLVQSNLVIAYDVFKLAQLEGCLNHIVLNHLRCLLLEEIVDRGVSLQKSVVVCSDCVVTEAILNALMHQVSVIFKQQLRN